VEIRFLNSVPAGSPSPIFEITVCKPIGVLFELSLQPSPFDAVDILKSYLTIFSSRKYRTKKNLASRYVDHFLRNF
jgi:hypothetical protein